MIRSIYIALFILLFTIESKVAMPYTQDYNYKITSVYVYNFIKYVEWPNKDKMGIFTIGIIGNSPIVAELKKITQTRKVNNQQVVVKNITVDEAKSCQLVLVSEAASNLIPKIFEITKNSPVLLVSEKEGYAKKYCSISLLIDEDDNFKTKFQLNKKNLQANGLRADSKLIELAVLVR